MLSGNAHVQELLSLQALELAGTADTRLKALDFFPTGNLESTEIKEEEKLAQRLQHCPTLLSAQHLLSFCMIVSE